MKKAIFAAVLATSSVAQSTLEMPFEPELGLGSAIGEEGKATFATAFDQKKMRETRLLRKETNRSSQKIEKTKVYGYDSMAESLKRNAGFSFDGWGGPAQVNFGFK